ncbi:MAG TPA: MFS transporter [Bryobacteraceae bacterium]|nr:MFS transporter [Bryobacteraceae bacterium]
MPQITSTRKWTIVVLLAVANIIAYVDRSNLAVAVTDIDFSTFFHLSNDDKGLLHSAFFWTYAFLQIPAGAVTDRYGVKFPLAVGFLFWSLVSGFTGFATSLWQLFALRMLLGIGEAAITPGSLRWIRFNLSENQRGLAVGIFFAGAKLGPAIGNYVSAKLILLQGWQGMFMVLGFGGLVWLIPWLFTVKNDDRQLESDANKHATSRAIPFSAVFRTPAIYGIIIGTFAYNYFNYFCLTWLPSYFVEHWKLSLTSMGVYSAFSFGGMAIVAILAGAVADRMIARGADPIRVRKGFTVAGLAVASTEIIGILSGSKDIAVAFSIISLAGLGLATANYWALTQSLMPGAAIGRIAGVQNFASNLSGIVAPILTGRLIQVTGSYYAPMAVVSGLLIAGVAAYVFLVQKKYAPRSEAI